MSNTSGEVSNMRRKRPTDLSDEELATQALDLAVAHIQKALGVTSGDFAAANFADQQAVDLLADYVARERVRKRAEIPASRRRA
jgi:hypothetical protein